MNRRTISSAYEPKPLVVDIDMHSLRSTLFGAKLLDVCALGGLGTGHRCYLLGGQSIILAMASTTAGSSASEGFGSFHLFHPTSILIPLGSRLFVLSLVCFGCFAFVLCVCVCVFLVLFLFGGCFHLDTQGSARFQSHPISSNRDVA